MNPAIHGGLKVLPGEARGRSRARPMVGWLVLVLAIAAMLVALSALPSSERRALHALPDEQRHALLSRTVEDLRQFCGQGRPRCAPMPQ